MGSNRHFYLVAFLFLAVSCRKIDPPCPLPPQNGALLEIPIGFPAVSFPADNAFTEARWRLGKKLFYDPILSITGTHSCASCHKTDFGMGDDLPTSPGVLGRPGKQNAPTLANVAYHPYILREGSLLTLEMQVLVPIQEVNEFNHNIVDISAVLQGDSEYVRMSMEAYNRNPDPPTTPPGTAPARCPRPEARNPAGTPSLYADALWPPSHRGSAAPARSARPAR